MGHSRRRPITGQTTANVVAAYYVIVEMNDRPTAIQCVANGTVTFALDSTLQNITYDAVALAAVNLSSPSDSDRYVAPTSAVWTAVQASGSVSVLNTIDTPIFAFRINQTAGTGSVSYTILQA